MGSRVLQDETSELDEKTPGLTEGPINKRGKPPEIGTELLGRRFRYRLEKAIGHGSFGSVFLAKTLAIQDELPTAQKPMALKVFYRQRIGSPVKALKRELSALLAIQNDRVPRVYDWSFEGEFPFVAMQYFPSNLVQQVAAGPLKERWVWRLLTDLLTALRAAHEVSILHLDIKPANVLADGEGGYVLTDFGISQSSHIHTAALAAGVGTRCYRAPEQRFKSAEYFDTRTDLWGVGVTCWAAAAGIELGNHPELLLPPSEKENSSGLPPLSRFRPDLSPHLMDMIMALVAFDSLQRPGSAAEALAQILALEEEWELLAGGISASPGVPMEADEVDGLRQSLLDPVLISAVRSAAMEPRFLKFPAGALLAREGEKAYQTYLLLRGRVRIEKGKEVLHVETREGTFLGEIATLSHQPRTASMIAEETVCVCCLNAAELEDFIVSQPALGLRLIRSMAARLARTT